MYFLIAGVVLIILKVMEIGLVGKWDWADRWYLFAAPFVLAVIWWAYADASGLTKKREMDKLDQKKKDRLNKNRVAMGMNTTTKKR